MSAKMSPEATRILERLRAVNRVKPVLDRKAVEGALAEHMTRLGVPPLPVRWVADATRGYLTAGRMARPAAHAACEAVAPLRGGHLPRLLSLEGVEGPAERAAREMARMEATNLNQEAGLKMMQNGEWSAALVLARAAAIRGALERWIGIWRPFVDAFEAGLWLWWVLKTAIVACPRPALQLAEDCLHCPDGPAVSWPRGARYYCWQGVRVPEKVIRRPQSLRVREILAEPSTEIRRVMIERYLPERFLLDAGARRIHCDETGELYHISLPGDEPLVMVKVLNSTPEPDGSAKPYFLRVPPWIQTAREAIAWTFGRSQWGYAPTMET